MTRHASFWRRYLLLFAGLGCYVVDPLASLSAAGEIQFNRDIRPILSENCFQCHGPDALTRQAGLRLDLASEATAILESGERAIAPGDSSSSGLVARVSAEDPSLKMPPPETGKQLTAEQIELLRRWIDSGAEYQGHWSWTAPSRPTPPPVDSTIAAANPIDAFVQARLRREGLSSEEEAPRETLLRRVTLDLTGLPPTPEQMQAFLEDRSPDAYERVVDRLLASPHHGERMAIDWLDAARYADTNGYNNDEPRVMWPWRDWVIGAFNRGMPFDQFVVEQIAGDLLPGATVEQRVATGFNRNHVLTTEGGIIEEEYRVEYVADRVHTTATVFLGMSMQCARCHSHKFDPLTQRDYYRFFAFFNQIADTIQGYSRTEPLPPIVKAPTMLQQRELEAGQAEQNRLEAVVQARQSQAPRLTADWEAALTEESRRSIIAAAAKPPAVRFSLDEPAEDGHEPGSGAAPAFQTSGATHPAAGKLAGGYEFDGGSHLDCGQVGAFSRSDRVSFGAWILPTSGEPLTVLSKMDESASHRGYDLIVEDGRLAVHLIDKWPDNGLKVIARSPMVLGAWHHVLATYDGSGKSAGVRLFVDGHPQETEIAKDAWQGELSTDNPFRIGRRSASCGFRGVIDDVRFYTLELSAQDALLLATGEEPAGAGRLLAVPPGERTAEQARELAEFYLSSIDADHRRDLAELAAVKQRLQAIEAAVPAVMVMQDLAQPRTTHMLSRGQYDQPGETVTPGVPESLPPLPEGAPANRLGLAQWLVDARNPLTARVAVNRWWRMFFGEGLVETVEDFGSQGASPTHPELLDWLAVELIESGWNVKKILRLMATSAAYRQSSRATPEKLERDPANRLLSRGPRFRLPAESIRDQALAAAGLLVETLGGPSVMPYQPAGLWEDVSVERRYVYTPDPGAGLYRRSMYTFWKRTCPPPAMTALDAPDRESCLARRARTNTPLQALILLNDPTYVEASRKLAERMLAGGNDQQRAALGAARVLGRELRPQELEVLLTILAAARGKFTADVKSAGELVGVGTSPPPPGDAAQTAELAAWTVVASTLLNLDEAITKN